MENDMSTSNYLLSLSLLFGTILFVFGMKYFSAAYAARARFASDEAYRALAEKAVAALAENQVALSAIRAELATVSATVVRVERVLKQVE